MLETAVLDEVTALVEWPVAVTGRFDPAYLRLPEEVLIATLQGHQRYFPVRGPDGKLLANFVTISNLRSHDPDQVRRGNERVVKPRLADAAFFWEQDLRKPLAARARGAGRRRVPARSRQPAGQVDAYRRARRAPRDDCSARRPKSS